MERSSKMDFFQKLGYSQEDVVRVLGKLGHGALVNDVLQELIQTGSRPRAQEGAASSSAPLLVPRGCCRGLDSAQQSLGPGLEEAGGDPASSLRPIVIDGSNVAMSHGNKEAFSCRGICLAVDWFRDRGHTYIKVFVPSWRKEPSRSDAPIREQHLLEELERQAVLVYTPSRKVNGKRVVCYDDRYIVKVAYEKDGVIVSNDNYRDLQSENPEWKWFIEQRLLMYSFVNDRFMPPDDPLGRRGPTLNNFLSKKPRPPEPSWQHCPYGRKCTYGIKCKFYHPERPHRTQLAVADELRAKRRGWPGGGLEELRPPMTRGSHAAARPVPQERSAHSLPPAPANLAALRGSFSRLAFSDNPAGSVESRPRGRDWPDTGGPAARTSPSQRVGSSASAGLSCPGMQGPGLHSFAIPAAPGDLPPPIVSKVQTPGGHSPGDELRALPPQRRPPDDRWALPPSSDSFLSHPAWAETAWSDPTFGGPSGSAPPEVNGGEADALALARTLLRSVFPPDQVDHVMASVPASSDLTGFINMLQSSLSTGVPLADP